MTIKLNKRSQNIKQKQSHEKEEKETWSHRPNNKSYRQTMKKSQRNTKEILILRKISRTEARCLQIERARHMDAKKIQTTKRQHRMSGHYRQGNEPLRIPKKVKQVTHQKSGIGRASAFTATLEPET